MIPEYVPDPAKWSRELEDGDSIELRAADDGRPIVHLELDATIFERSIDEVRELHAALGELLEVAAREVAA